MHKRDLLIFTFLAQLPVMIPQKRFIEDLEDVADENGFFNGVFDDGEGFELTEGTWDLTYTIKDSAGNITSIRDTLNVVIDLTAPAAPTFPISKCI